MIEARICRSLFLLTLLAAVAQIQPSLHGHNNAFVQDDSDVQYLLDSLPISMHKDFANSVHGTGDSPSEENIQDSLSYIEFEPNILDFKERQLGVPHQETVTLFNRDDNRTIHLSSISGNTQHFHSSFFQDKVIPPLGNTTFNVVFLGREEGEIDSYLFIHTSEGNLKYQVKGVSISSPYRLRPVVGVKLPINASFTPLIYVHNPHSEPMQVVEVYSSGREFQLELPSGEVEGPRELWEIPPYQTKPVIRLHFNAYTEKNHTAYIRFRVNNSAEILVMAVEIEVSSGAGLHWGGSSGVINFGLGGSYQPPFRYQIALKNSAKKPVKVQNIISTPTSKALKINFEPIIIPGDTEIPVTVGSLVYDWKAGLDLKHFKGKLMIKGVGPGGSSQKLAIPWMAEVLHGGLEVNASAAHYCSPHSSQPRNFSVVNKFKLPLAITNVSLPSEAALLFSISNFVPKILKSGQRDDIFTLSLTQNLKHENLQFESSILIHSNVSTTEVPLLSYNGKLRKIIPGERESDKGTMNFGTVSSGTENEGVFALENQNPVSIELHGWGVNMPGAVLELMGCQNGPTDLFNKGVRNITACSVSGNQSIKPGYLAIFKIKVKTPHVKEDTIVGDVFVKTTYERLTVPVYMRVAHGKISMKKLTFTDCFPGSICVQQIKIHSTFVRPMEVTFIEPVHKDERVKYIPLEEASYPVISKGDNHIGSIVIDPLVTCKQQCYLGLSLNNSVGSQWLNTLSLPSHTRDSDLNLLNTRYTRYLNTTSGGSWDNITMQLDTSEVRGYKFTVNMKPHWPSLLMETVGSKNKSLLSFPLTQVGSTSYKNITLHNPSLNPLLLHLVMDWGYPQGSRLFQSLPNKFKPTCSECPSTVQGEFKLHDSNEKDLFEQEWNIACAQHSIPLVLEPNQTRTIRLSYTPSLATSSSALLYIRNNLTILEVLRLVGRGAHAQFKFGNRKPGSPKPLLFELTEKHLKDCKTASVNKQSASEPENFQPNLSLRRTFLARNTGELPIDVRTFYINGLACEGYGFKVLNCAPFTLQPNDSRKIDIAFTPDFTLARVERNLLIETSMGPEMREDNEDNDGNDGIDNEEEAEIKHQNDGVVKLNLLSTIPANTLEACAAVLVRPSWEQALQYTATGLTIVLLVCVLATAVLEADRILRGALVSISRGNPTQPPLDLRLLSHSSPMQQQHGFHANNNHANNHHGKEKLVHISDDVNRPNGKTANSKRDESALSSASTSLVWSFVNGKRGKGSQAKQQQPPPPPPLANWSAEEERRFRQDTESQDGLKRCIDLSLGPEPSNSGSGGGGSKKRNNKQQRHSAPDVTPANGVADTMDMQLDKKSSNKSSPAGTRKGKATANKEESVKLVEHELQVNGFVNGKDASKPENGKRKQIAGGAVNNVGNNHNAFRKYEAHPSQKATQYSEEETSSTTTESSLQEDNNAYKDCDTGCEKSEKNQRKAAKKSKQETTPAMPSLDYKDNYEGDSDDDYEKDKQEDNPNRWKTSTTRSSGKHQPTRPNADASAKLPRQKQNPSKKEKTSQKRRNAEKSQVKAPMANGIATQREESAPTTTVAAITSTTTVTSTAATVTTKPTATVAATPVTVSPAPLQQPPLTVAVSPQPQNVLPPPVCWGENRAKFSDVVARNQDNSSPFANHSSNSRSHKPTSGGAFGLLDGTDCSKRLSSQEQATNEFKFTTKRTDKDESSSNSGVLGLKSNSHLNSYFANTFSEPTYEPELIPYDDLPDTDEPLVELENNDDKLWQNNSPILNLITDDFSLDSSKPIEKISNLSDSLKDNWIAVDTNWEPLYNRGAVGEERSGFWGVNTGGVWAAAPWGAPPPPTTLQNTTLSQTREPSVQERSGFDPFRSLSTIWTPSSSDTWTTKQKE